jgi:hypothetical protein
MWLCGAACAGAAIACAGQGQYWPALRDVFARGFQTGGIVGAFTIISGDGFCHASRWAEGLCFNWELADARRVPFFPCKGRQGFFMVDYPAVPALVMREEGA